MHEPYVRIVPGAQNAVVFIHGVVSTPRYWDEFVQATPQSWSVNSLLLPGHGGSVQDFGRTRRGEWLRHVRTVINDMRRSHERIFIVAHSLGTLLAVQAVLEEAEGIAGLLLLAMPLRIFVRPSALFRNALKGLGVTENSANLARYYGTAQDWRFWRYIPWIPRYLELFAISADVRRRLPGLKTPTQVFMSGRDELVSLRSCRELERCTAAKVVVLPGSMHHELNPEDSRRVFACWHDMCNQ